MKIEVKLEDPQFCEGCPYLEPRWRGCGRGYIRLGEWAWFPLSCYWSAEWGARPRECIEKHGL